MLTKFCFMLLSLMVLTCAVFAQDETAVSFNDSALPQTSKNINEFVPEGWNIEEQIAGDLNADSLPDAALKLIEKPATTATADNPVSRARVLMILFKTKTGIFERVAVAKTLLQCTGCGGAFYGVSPAPANVKIDKGVLIVDQDNGSRNVFNETFKFRYDAKVKKFALIGFDTIDNDRVTGATTTESINYVTGTKIKKISQYNQQTDKTVAKSNKKSSVAKTPIYLEKINYETFGNR